MDSNKKRTADLGFSIILMLVSLWFAVKSIKLFSNPFSQAADRLTQEEIDRNLAEWFQSPGLVPLIFAILLFVCAVSLFVIAWKSGARFDFITKENLSKLKVNKEARTALKIIVLTGVYIYALIPLSRKFLNLIPKFQGFPFMIATLIYLIVFILMFNSKSKKDIIISIIVAVCGAVFITLGFGVAAQILLP